MTPATASLIWLLAIPAGIMLLVYMAMSIYRKYKDSKLVEAVENPATTLNMSDGTGFGPIAIGKYDEAYDDMVVITDAITGKSQTVRLEEIVESVEELIKSDSRLNFNQQQALLRGLPRKPQKRVRSPHAIPMPQGREMETVTRVKALEDLTQNLDPFIQELVADAVRTKLAAEASPPAPTAHELAEQDKLTMEQIGELMTAVEEELLKPSAVDRRSFEVVVVTKAQDLFQDMVKEELKDVPFDELSWYAEEPTHSKHQRTLASNRAVPRFAEYAKDKQFISNVGGQVAHFCPEIVDPIPPAPKLSLEEQLKERDAKRAAAEAQTAIAAKVTESIERTLTWRIEHSIKSLMPKLLSDALKGIMDSLKAEAKREAEDDLFHKQVEAEERAKAEGQMFDPGEPGDLEPAPTVDQLTKEYLDLPPEAAKAHYLAAKGAMLKLFGMEESTKPAPKKAKKQPKKRKL